MELNVATTLTRNLKLRINSNLTSDAKYNLEKIDGLGATFLVDSTDVLNIRSVTNITIEPESADIGGSGVGGSLTIGTADHSLSAVSIHTDEFLVDSLLSTLDQATNGTKYLKVQYKSDLNGSVDTTADRILSFDLEGGDRDVILAGDYSQLGGSLSLTLTGDSVLTLPTTGTLSTLAGTEVLTNKTIDADLNTLSNVRNANVASNAAIAYSKLNLASSIVNSDVSSSAAIAYSKLNLSNSILNADVASGAGIIYSKLDLSNSIDDGDISPTADIAYSKLDLTASIVNADISASAAIAGTKVSPDFGSQDILTDGSLSLGNGSFSTSFEANSGQGSNLSYTLPDIAAEASQVLRASSSDPTVLEWADVAGTGTVTSVALAANPGSIFDVSGSPITSAGTLTLGLDDQAANLVLAGPATGSPDEPAFRSLVVADIPSGIDHGGLSGLSDDDHTQYHTDSRALTWLGTRSTSDLAEGTNLYYTNTRFDTRFATKSTTDLVEGSNLYYTDERAQDAVGNILTDSSSIDFTYNDGTPSVTAALKLSAASPDAGQFNAVTSLETDGLQVQVQNSDVQAVVDGYSFKTNWTSGTTFSATHNLGSRDVLVQLYDNTTFETLYVDSVVRTDSNTVDFTSSSAPTGSGWRVLIRRI